MGSVGINVLLATIKHLSRPLSAPLSPIDAMYALLTVSLATATHNTVVFPAPNSTISPKACASPPVLQAATPTQSPIPVLYVPVDANNAHLQHNAHHVNQITI